MKPLFLFCILSLIVLNGYAQVVLIDTSNSIPKEPLTKKIIDSSVVMADSLKPISIPDSVASRRTMLNKTNMTVLLAWSGANLVQGSISAGNLKGSPHYFHQMNAYFNIINLAIAGYGIYEVRKQMNKKLSLLQNLRQQQK